MRKLQHRQVQRRLRDILAYLRSFEPRTAELCERANTDEDDGVAGIDYAGKSRKSGPSDPTQARAQHRRDEIARAAHTIADALANIEHEARRMDRAAWSLMALSDDEARILAEKDEVAHRPEQQTISATCANMNCKRPVARTKDDRLREGRCENCYRYRHAHGVERPKLFCDAERNIGEALGLDAERLIVDGAA